VDLRAGAPGNRGQLGGERAHASNRHIPAPGPASDHVIEEAAVLPQKRIVRGRERPDRRVRAYDAAHQVRGEGPLERQRQRILEQRLPRVVIVDQLAHLLTAAQRLRQRGEHPLRDAGQHGLKALPRFECARIAGDARHRALGGIGFIAQQQPGPARRRVRGDGAGPEPCAQAQRVDDRPR
jgi:hypothetical protein